MLTQLKRKGLAGLIALPVYHAPASLLYGRGYKQSLTVKSCLIFPWFPYLVCFDVL